MVVPNAAARHERLSLTAVGLLVRLLSMPDGAKATIDTVTEQVSEGRRAVAKAFSALEDAGYLRRERGQDPETGLWGTQTHVSDLPMNRIPTVGAPRHRNVGDLPKGDKNQEKNLLPDPSTEAQAEKAPKADAEEDEASGEKNAQTAPADAETGRAATTLAHLGAIDSRLKLSTNEVLRLAPLAAEWLAEGHSTMKITAVLSARLPERVDSAAALVAYRLRNQMPAKPTPKAPPAPDTRDRCDVCRAPFPQGRQGDLCGACREELDRAAAFLAADPELPTTEPAQTDTPASRGRALCRAVLAA
ncbi:hypothetical protein BLA24_25845 [Streptomyces cinnamoneus]|uniref:Helix-turn-helix domain-containing protein n=1 Tax=Streptomyces cinnamoneus TaxID=53446 RepID=A0A2G1XE11_STRCJ|nr:hypothetical protein BLA24_25845 [Streptomyces cinnamoneus]